LYKRFKLTLCYWKCLARSGVCVRNFSKLGTPFLFSASLFLVSISSKFLSFYFLDDPPAPQPNKQTTPRPTPPIDPQARIDLLDHWTRSIEKMTKSPDIFKNLSNSNNSIVSYSNNSNVDKNNLSKSGRCSFKDTQSTTSPIVHGTGSPATENLSLEQKTVSNLHILRGGVGFI